MIDNPEQRAALSLLNDTIIPVLNVKPDLYPVLAFKVINISLKHGNADVSSFAYMTYAYLLATVLDQPAQAYAFGKLAFALNEKIPNASQVPRLNTSFGAYLHYCEPLRAAIPYFERSLQAALECGDYIYIAYSIKQLLATKLGAGYPLGDVVEDIERFTPLVKQIGDAGVASSLVIAKQMIANLQGRTSSRGSLSDESFDEGQLANGTDPSANLMYYLVKLQLHYLHGDYASAGALAGEAQAIASETALPKVVERLSKIVLESAGADRGALILGQNDRLVVEAIFSVDQNAPEGGINAALESRSDIAQSVALYVSRISEPVELSNAGADGRFAADPRIASGQVKSLVCLPLLYQDRLMGLLYLENTRVSFAFDQARIEVLTLICSQAAIAIENARLVADVQAANKEVKRANEHLEAVVNERTQELQISNMELGATNARLELELAEREAAERERAALKEQMIEAQRARLTEMSTPLIPITDRIMAMPLIGTVDEERAAQVLSVALTGAQQHGARVVILDITGLKQIDARAIRALLDCAKALKLLGTHAVLTGIRAEVAHTIVELDADLGSITTKSTLQSGIAYALKISGELVGQGYSTHFHR